MWEYGISTHSLLLMLPLKETEPLPRLEHPLMGLCGGRDGDRVREHSAKGSISIMYLPSLLASFLPQTPPHHHNFFFYGGAIGHGWILASAGCQWWSCVIQWF